MFPQLKSLYRIFFASSYLSVCTVSMVKIIQLVLIVSLLWERKDKHETQVNGGQGVAVLSMLHLDEPPHRNCIDFVNNR